MEKYVEQTKLVIGILQEKMSQASFEKSQEAGIDMYSEIGRIAEEKGLNLQELWNAVGTIYLGILEMVDEGHGKGER